MKLKLMTRPVEVEAVRFDGDNVDEVLAFCPHAQWNRPELTIDLDHADTDGVDHVPVGWWVVKTPNDVFRAREQAYVDKHYQPFQTPPTDSKTCLVHGESATAGCVECAYLALLRWKQTRDEAPELQKLIAFLKAHHAALIGAGTELTKMPMALAVALGNEANLVKSFITYLEAF